MRIHIFGASGSGTTTLGRALAERLGVEHHDADDVFWEPTDPPFTTIVPTELRQARLKSALRNAPGWILSGCIRGWGDFLIPELDLSVFLFLRPEVRMARLRRRETERYGDRIAEGGDMHAQHHAFVTWAQAYDTGGMEMRSQTSQTEWFTSLPGPRLRLDGELELEEKVKAVLEVCRGIPGCLGGRERLLDVPHPTLLSRPNGAMIGKDL